MSNLIATEDIFRMTRDVWTQMLGIELEMAESDALADIAASETVTGCVQITGEFRGAVTVACSIEMARRAACVMFDIEDPADASLEDVNDVLGELAHMVGGNLKAVLPGPSHLSLPAVISGVDYQLIVPRSRPAGGVSLRAGEQPVKVAILEHDERARRAA